MTPLPRRWSAPGQDRGAGTARQARSMSRRRRRPRRGRLAAGQRRRRARAAAHRTQRAGSTHS